MSDFLPPENKDVDIRPLNKGMILDQPSQTIPNEAFLTLENFVANKEGPRRRSGFQRFANNDSTPYRMLDMVTLWKTNGSQETILITDKILYSVGQTSGLTERVWEYTTGTVTVAGTAVTGNGTLWTTLAGNVKAGDLFRCGTDEAEISSVDSNTTLTLKTTGGTHSAGASYSIVRAFSVQFPNTVDKSVKYNELLLCDGSRPIVKYDANTLAVTYFVGSSAYGIGGSENVVPICIARFLDRTWVGYMKEATDGTRRQRIRWDKITVPSDFSTTTNWMELNETTGSLKRLIPNGNVLVAYLDDGIYFLIQTNFPTLPLRPQRIETGGIGLVGQRAVMPWMGGHFFVGQDDIYFLGPNGIEGIGSSIIRSALRGCSHLEDIQVAVDPSNYRILFGFPKSTQKMEYLWSLDYRSKTWSYDKASTYMISNPIISSMVTWDDLSGTDWDDLDTLYPSWNQIRLSEVTRSLYLELNGTLTKNDPDYIADWDGISANTNITGKIVTKDFDFDNPSLNKVVTRFAIKIEEDISRTLPIVFLVEASVNKGKSWKTCGMLTIPIDKDEGYVNFRSSGSTIRFRLTTNSGVAPYYLGEMSLRVGKSGDESRLGNQNT